LPNGGRARALAIERGIWAIVADAPEEHFSQQRLEAELQDVEAITQHALAHASLVEYFFRRAPVIPLKLFTMFSSDERARQRLAARAPALRKLFGRLRGLEEWGVRITAAAVSTAADASSANSGREYLTAKKRLRDGEVPREAQRAVSSALATLKKAAARVERDDFPPPAPGRPYVVGASFLVRAAKRIAWLKLVRSLERELGAQGHKLDASGPWPPYHFTGTPR
jgi:hypothetical protein